MKYIFLITTEHHLFQVEAAKQHFSLSKEDMILVVMNLGDIPRFIDRVKKDKSFSEVHIFDTWVFKDLFINRRNLNRFIEFCNSIKNTKQNYTFLFSQYESDPDLLFLSIVQPKFTFLMDEGTASFTIVHNRANKHLHYKANLKLVLKSALYFTKISFPKVVTYFTKYNLQVTGNDKIERYQVIKNNNSFMTTVKSQAAFLGTSIVEIEMLREDIYLSFLKTIFLENVSKEFFYYYPHRKESPEKLQKIEDIGFIIKHIGVPFETFFEQQTTCSELLCSFFTTSVLDNISKSNTNIPILRVYKFNTQLLNFDKEVYEALYAKMSENKNIQFEEI